MKAILKTFYIVLMAIITVLLWFLFQWFNPLKKILESNLDYYALEMAKLCRQYGNDDIAEHLENLVNNDMRD